MTDLCEQKIAVNPHVKVEMESLRTECYLKLSVTPVYNLNHISLKICFLNARSLHRHIDDVRHDLNYSSTDINIFAETRFASSDNDNMYTINGCTLFRNDRQSSVTLRPCGGTAIYSTVEFIPSYPYFRNTNGTEITIMKLIILPHVTIIGVYRSPKIPLSQLCHALNEVLAITTSQFNIIIGDFNINWLDEHGRRPLYNLFVNNNNYRQLISSYTTDNQTTIDHIYTNLPQSQTYFSDHKSICALINCFNE